MTLFPWVLLVVGLLLILLEFYIPGSIMATIGLIFLGGALLFMALEVPWWGTLLFLCLMVFSVVAVIQLALRLIRRTGPENTLFLGDTQEGYTASWVDLSLIGQEGIVISDLKPSGFILVGEKELQAAADVGYIERGKRVKLLRAQGACFIVREV